MYGVKRAIIANGEADINRKRVESYWSTQIDLGIFYSQKWRKYALKLWKCVTTYVNMNSCMLFCTDMTRYLLNIGAQLAPLTTNFPRFYVLNRSIIDAWEYILCRPRLWETLRGCLPLLNLWSKGDTFNIMLLAVVYGY